jgi:hypothetical protein
MKIKPTKKRIAILGENPDNDSDAFRYLLEQRPYPLVQFSVPIRNIKGGQMDVPLAVVRHIKAALQRESFENIILIRDLDDVLSNQTALQTKDDWFSIINKELNGKGIFYLAIAETEALFLADVKSLNKIYKLTLKPYGNPMSLKDPKEELQKQTSKSKNPYKENVALEIMKKMDFQTIYDNHKGKRSFQSFINELDEILT